MKLNSHVIHNVFQKLAGTAMGSNRWPRMELNIRFHALRASITRKVNMVGSEDFKTSQCKENLSLWLAG